MDSSALAVSRRAAGAAGGPTLTATVRRPTAVLQTMALTLRNAQLSAPADRMQCVCGSWRDRYLISDSRSTSLDAHACHGSRRTCHEPGARRSRRTRAQLAPWRARWPQLNSIKLTAALPKGKLAVKGFTLNKEHFTDTKFNNLQCEVAVFKGVTIDQGIRDKIDQAHRSCFTSDRVISHERSRRASRTHRRVWSWTSHTGGLQDRVPAYARAPTAVPGGDVGDP